MEMKIYEINGRTAWYWPSDVPEGAKEWKPAKPKAEKKEVKPENKSSKPSTK